MVLHKKKLLKIYGLLFYLTPTACHFVLWLLNLAACFSENGNCSGCMFANSEKDGK